jgi:hypothetical protein
MSDPQRDRLAYHHKFKPGDLNSGDIVDFVMLVEGLDRDAAIKRLAMMLIDPLSQLLYGQESQCPSLHKN